MAARVGLTGGIGSGKSTVAGLFSALGVLVVDADQIAREVVLPDSKGLKAIIDRFGNTVLQQNGTLDRKALSKIIFSGPDERIWLEALLHPMIREQMDALAAQCADPYCLLEIPLLIESNRQVDRVVVVHCSRALRIERLLSSREMSRADIIRIMETQASDEERLAQADNVIHNEGEETELVAQVKALHDALTATYTN